MTISNTCAGAMIEIPDFGSMSDEEVKKFAMSSGFGERDQQALVNSTDRQKEYVRLIKWQMVIEARKDIYQARLTLREQRIFMPSDLTRQFSDVIERMNSVQVERHVALQHPWARDQYKVSEAWLLDCTPVFEEMATQANRRLFREERDATRAQGRLA